MARLIPSPRTSLAKLAAALAVGTMFTVGAPILTPTSLGVVTVAKAQEPSQFKSILSSYGEFQAHAKYGEVWVPARATVLEGWHPYEPCKWVHTKDLGWYYDDKTDWGRIVHHYGRWAHDKDLGWVWVKGDEFSPGWVVWRTSDKHVGWAPMPPEADLREISAAQFNNDKHWIFMDSKKFGSQCDGGSTIASTPPALYPVIFQETKLVTEIKFVGGIAIFVLPPPLIINIVDINIGIFPPWSPCFFGAWFWQWNMLVNNVIINVNINNNQCKPTPVQQPAKPIPIISIPPPGPGTKPPAPDRRTELPPPRQLDPRPLDPGYNPRPRPFDPPVVRDPGRIPPVVVIPDRPTRPNGPIVTPDKPPRIPPVVIKDPPPRLPPVVIKDPPKRPSGPIIVERAPRLNKPLGEVNRIPRSNQVSNRQPVPRITRLDKAAEARPRVSIPGRSNGPVIR